MPTKLPDVNLKKLQARRLLLLKEIAKVVRYELRGGMPKYRVANLKEQSSWARATYDFPEKIDPKDDGVAFVQDLNELVRRDHVFTYRLTGPRTPAGEPMYGPDVNTWVICLEPKGLAAVEEAMKPWYVKAYEKQPVTAVQVVATTLFSVVAFVAGFFAGKATTPTPTPAQVTPIPAVVSATSPTTSAS